MSNNFKENLSEKVFYIILSNKNNNNTFNVEKFLKILCIDKNEFIDYCMNDKRLKIIEDEEKTLIDIVDSYITHNNIYQANLIHLWKERIIKFLKKKNNAEITELVSFIKRPTKMLNIIRLEDILKFDYKRRFLITCENSITKINYKFTPEELKLLYNKWLNNIEDYLKSQDNIEFSLSFLGSIVKKPYNLGKNQKLLNIIKNDRRFELIEDKQHNSLIKIKLFNHNRNNIIHLSQPGLNNFNYTKIIKYSPTYEKVKHSIDNNLYYT